VRKRRQKRNPPPNSTKSASDLGQLSERPSLKLTSRNNTPIYEEQHKQTPYELKTTHTYNQIPKTHPQKNHHPSLLLQHAMNNSKTAQTRHKCAKEKKSSSAWDRTRNLPVARLV
jgi:hypothetical protein